MILASCCIVALQASAPPSRPSPCVCVVDQRLAVCRIELEEPRVAHALSAKDGGAGAAAAKGAAVGCSGTEAVFGCVGEEEQSVARAAA